MTGRPDRLEQWKCLTIIDTSGSFGPTGSSHRPTASLAFPLKPY
jgi:hypothetical protein